MKLSLVVPAHNEEDNIQNLINRIIQGVDIDNELVIVNDHSTDNTAKLVLESARAHKNIKLVENYLDKGFANALKAGFASSRGDIIVPVMGDLCDDLNTLRQMLNKIEEGFDVVCGSRYIKGGARLGGSRIKGFFSSLGGRSIHFVLGIPTNDIANAFKMYRKEVLGNIVINSKGFEVSMEIPLKAYFLGYKITEVATVWKERVRGKSSFKVFKLLPSYLKLYAWAIFRKIGGKFA